MSGDENEKDTTAQGGDAAGDAGEVAAEVTLSDDVLDEMERLIEDMPDLANDADRDRAKEWLEEWRQPLTFLTHDTLMSFFRHVSRNVVGGRRKEIIGQMSPDEKIALARANANALEDLATQRLREVALLDKAAEKLTSSVSSVLSRALLAALA